VFQLAFHYQKSDDLAQKKRIALGLLVDSLNEFFSRHDSGSHLNKPGDVLFGQTAQDDARAQSQSRQLTKRLQERVMTSQVYVAIRADDQNRRIFHVPGKELKQQQRRFVSPMQVIENNDKRLAPAGVLEKSGNAIEKTKPRL